MRRSVWCIQQDKVQVYHSLFGVLAFLAFTKVHLWSLTSKTRRTRGVLWRRLTHVTYPFSTKNKNTKQSTTIRNDLFADWSSRRKCKICCCRCRRRQLRPTVLLRKLNWLKDTHKSSTDNQKQESSDRPSTYHGHYICDGMKFDWMLHSNGNKLKFHCRFRHRNETKGRIT